MESHGSFRVRVFGFGVLGFWGFGFGFEVSVRFWGAKANGDSKTTERNDNPKTTNRKRKT
jgi:hypothetical protein